MVKCNLCDRSFSRREGLSRHYTQLHSHTQYSQTLNWVKNQQSDVFFQQKPLQPLDNIWETSQNAQNVNNKEISNFLSKSIFDKQNSPLFKDYVIEEEEYENNKYKNIIESKEYKSVTEEKEYTNIIEEKENQWPIDNDGSSVGSAEDFCGVSLADAYDDLNSESKQNLPLWPSETYKEFMTAVTQYRLSDAAGDSMLRIIKRHCTEPLPGSTRKGRIYMDQMDIKNLNFKTKTLREFEGETYQLQYRPIFDAIKSIISNPDLSKYFLFDYDEQWELGNVSYNFICINN